tara:strand:- start:311 stop:1534 length:1224 start_codon:yes stop_codon:yes gene_type:complete
LLLRKMKNKEIYLDHAATTYVDARVKDAMMPFFSEEYGNPGSFNSVGIRIKEALSNCRNTVAGLINCRPREVIFTGSGTESINMAIQGIVRAQKSKGKHIITSETEHHAVLETCEYLEKEGFEVTYLKPDQQGMITAEQVKEVIREDTILISIIYANNEVGTINPIKEIAQVAKEAKVVFHTDACQAGGVLDIDVKNLGVNLMTLNGSKIYGPKGTGILFVKMGTSIKPLIFGGGQEFGLRSGTENIPGIVGFTKALELAQNEREEEFAKLTELRDKLIKGISETIPDTILNGHPTKRLPNNANISFLNIEGEALLLHLNEFGICASSGSACTSQTLDPSHVLISMGTPYELAHGSLRFTLGKKTTEEEINKVIEVLPNIVKILRLISPFNQRMEDFVQQTVEVKGN